MEEGGEYSIASETGTSKEVFKSHLREETDFPENLIEDFLSLAPGDIDISAVRYKDYYGSPSKERDFERSMVLVHMTDYFPEDNRILTPRDVSLREGGDPGERYRLSIHASLGSPVASHSGGDWSDCRYAILVPFESFAGNIISFEPEDVFGIGPIELDNLTRIISFNQDEKDRAIRSMLSRGCIDVATMMQLVRAASRSLHIEKVVEQTISDTNWQVDVKNLVSLLPDDHEYRELIAGLDNLRISRNLDSPIHYLVAKEIVRMGRLPMFFENRREEAKSTFARPSGRQHSVHLWASSGLVRFLRSSYNQDEATVASKGNVRRLHQETPWYDFERLYRVCAIKEPHPFMTSSPLSRELVSISDQRERIGRAKELIKRGGYLRGELLKQTSRFSREKRRYVGLAIKNLSKDLDHLLSDLQL